MQPGLRPTRLFRRFDMRSPNDARWGRRDSERRLIGTFGQRLLRTAADAREGHIHETQAIPPHASRTGQMAIGGSLPRLCLGLARSLAELIRQRAPRPEDPVQDPRLAERLGERGYAEHQQHASQLRSAPEGHAAHGVRRVVRVQVIDCSN